MKKKRYSFRALCALLLASCGGDNNSENVVTGEGYPNPNPVITDWKSTIKMVTISNQDIAMVALVDCSSLMMTWYMRLIPNLALFGMSRGIAV